MKYFIFGGRRSGKTTQCLKIIEKTQGAIVWETTEKRKRDILGMLGGRKIHNNNFGFLNYIRVYDDLDTYLKLEKDITSVRIFHPLVTLEEATEIVNNLYLSKLDWLGTDTIVTCTPDNTENRFYTPSYILYLAAIKSPDWKVINLGFYNEIQDVKDSLPEDYILGQIYGKWYEKEDKTKVEKKAKEV